MIVVSLLGASRSLMYEGVMHLEGFMTAMG